MPHPGAQESLEILQLIQDQRWEDLRSYLRTDQFPPKGFAKLVNTGIGEPRSLLTWAVDREDETGAMILLEERERDIRQRGRDYEPALQAAAMWNHAAVIEFLITRCRALTQYQSFPHAQYLDGLCVFALAFHCPDAYKVLMKARSTAYYGDPPFTYHPKPSRLTLDEQFKAASRVYRDCGTGGTPLHVLANLRIAKVEAIQTLLRWGVDVNALDFGGRTALSLAAMNPSEQAPMIMDALVTSAPNLDPNIRDAEGKTALHRVIEQIASMTEVLESYYQCFAYLLGIPGIDLNPQDNNRTTPLMMACKGRLDIVAIGLMDAGLTAIQVNARDNAGIAAPFMAIDRDQIDILARMAEGDLLDLASRHPHHRNLDLVAYARRVRAFHCAEYLASLQQFEPPTRTRMQLSGGRYVYLD